jgi:hypothetical protein
MAKGAASLSDLLYVRDAPRLVRFWQSLHEQPNREYPRPARHSDPFRHSLPVAERASAGRGFSPNASVCRRITARISNVVSTFHQFLNEGLEKALKAICASNVLTNLLFWE